MIRRLLRLPVPERPDTSFVTVVYSTRDKFAGMSDDEIRYHRDNRHGR